MFPPQALLAHVRVLQVGVGSPDLRVPVGLATEAALGPRDGAHHHGLIRAADVVPRRLGAV